MNDGTRVQMTMNQHRMLGLSLLLLSGFFLGNAAVADEAAIVRPAKPTKPEKPKSETEPSDSFQGSWTTDFGVMNLEQSGSSVQGSYGLGTIEGKVEGRVLTFRYKEAQVSGTGKFVLARDGQSFEGTWSEEGQSQSSRWNGKRQQLTFDGLWETDLGPLRLVQTAEKVRGGYEYSGINGSLEGEIKEHRLIVRYQDEREGAAWFELSPDRMRLSGRWRARRVQSVGTVDGTACCSQAGAGLVNDS